MGGKRNRTEAVEERDDRKGCATDTSGLTALDHEREASLADEGGASGAAAETQDAPSPSPDKRSTRHGG
jgi:hypothetical protein